MIEIPTLTEHNQRLRDATERSAQLKQQLNKAMSLIKKLRKANSKMKSDLQRHGVYRDDRKTIAMKMIKDGRKTEDIMKETGFARDYIYKLRCRNKKAAAG